MAEMMPSLGSHGGRPCINVGARLKLATDSKGKPKEPSYDKQNRITRESYGNFDRAIWIPMHLVEIVPFQPLTRMLDKDETKIMTEKACERPPMIQGRIETHGVNLLGLGKAEYFVSTFLPMFVIC